MPLASYHRHAWRYRHDALFAHLVDSFVRALRDHTFSQRDLFDALVLAIALEAETPPPALSDLEAPRESRP